MGGQKSAAVAFQDSSAFIEVKQLTKRFAEVVAVDRISFDVHKGELFGFLGPNGAGKTTTINLLTGLARPDSGTIHIGGLDCARFFRPDGRARDQAAEQHRGRHPAKNAPGLPPSEPDFIGPRGGHLVL